MQIKNYLESQGIKRWNTERDKIINRMKMHDRTAFLWQWEGEDDDLGSGVDPVKQKVKGIPRQRRGRVDKAIPHGSRSQQFWSYYTRRVQRNN